MQTLLKSATRIYLAEGNEWYKNESSIQRVGIFDANGLPGGKFKIFETTILPGQFWEKPLLSGGVQICIPLLGSIFLEEGKFLEPGECTYFFSPNGKPIQVENPHQYDSIHFLWIEIPCPHATGARSIAFRLEDKLCHIAQIELLGTLISLNLYLGKIAGRHDARMLTEGSSLGFVLSGAFEYQNCLLEQGDGLWIEEGTVIEMESLTAEGLVVLLEFEE